MRLADYPEVTVELTPNAYECVEDDETFTLRPSEEFDEDETLCPYDDGHYVKPILIAAKDAVPDGIPQEIADDYYHHGNEQYEFALEPGE